MKTRAPGGGRKPKPHGLKVLQGTARPGDEPDVEFPVADSDNNAPPYWLNNEHATKEWDRLYPMLTATRVLTEADRTKLGLLCMTLSQVLKMYAVDQYPSASLLGRLQSLYSDFGLDPVSRSRVKVAGEAKSKNPFAKLGTG